MRNLRVVIIDNDTDETLEALTLSHTVEEVRREFPDQDETDVNRMAVFQIMEEASKAIKKLAR